MAKYLIDTKITEIIWNVRDIIEKNIPDYTEVNKEEFLDFVKSNNINRYDNNVDDFPPQTIKRNYYDKYNNIIAFKHKYTQAQNWTYHINPGLRDKSIELQMQIQDKYGEPYEQKFEHVQQPRTSDIVYDYSFSLPHTKYTDMCTTSWVQWNKIK